MVATVENYLSDIVAVEFGSGQPVKAGHLGEYSQIPRSQRGPRVRQQPADPLPAVLEAAPAADHCYPSHTGSFQRRVHTEGSEPSAMRIGRAWVMPVA